MWEKDKSCLICVAPGLYQICFGFYSKKAPSVQIFLNGEPLMNAAQKQMQLHNNKENQTTNSKHTAGNVTGLTHNDYIALPPRARLAIVYQGETFGEGFICLRKL